jgi:hypothetical protein
MKTGDTLIIHYGRPGDNCGTSLSFYTAEDAEDGEDN